MDRIIGTEVEYGISSPAEPGLSPIVTSTRLVLAYAAHHTAAIGARRRPRWDYAPESPLRDARGFDLGAARPTPVIDADAVGAASMVLTNGARFYVDHAHPEYSAPEVTDPLDAVIWDVAGERIMEHAAELASAVPEAPSLVTYKNNIDGKGASYGTHENYLCRRDTPFEHLVSGLTPFFVTRQVYAGAGRVGLGEYGDTPGFQLSQRADYIEVEVGLETTLRRGIINTRDEPHADAERHRRLHVIIGDANLAETATYLKVGVTALVLDAIEAGETFTDLELLDPVAAVRQVSRDLSLRRPLALADGRHLSAIDIQREYCARVRRHLETHGRDDRAEHVLATWIGILDELANDPMSCADRLDWPAKLRLLDGFRVRENLTWAAPRLALIDLQYSDNRRDRGLYHRLVARGSMRRLTTESQVQAAIATPPESTRAWFRGECVRRYGDAVAAAAWESVVLDTPKGLVRVPLTDPLRGSRARASVLETATDAEALVDALGGGAA